MAGVLSMTKMATRRWFCGLLACLPFMRAGRSEVVPEPPVYAEMGTVVTCTNLHPICAFGKRVMTGQIYAPGDLVEWTQREPERGEFPIPRCEKCGAEWGRGMHFFFNGEWH